MRGPCSPPAGAGDCGSLVEFLFPRGIASEHGALLLADSVAVDPHKWLYAPKGTGMLYVRKEKIAKIWPVRSESW